MSTQIDPREKDIQALCISVLYMSTKFYDNPNGGYESTCPFCYTRVDRGGSDDIQASMGELEHKPNCAYLIAKDLSTGY